MKILSITTACLLLVSSCDKCSDDPPPIAPVSFYFVNRQGVNLVKESNAPYHPDSIRITLQNKPILFQKEYDSQTDGYKFSVFTMGDESGGNLFLIHLNQVDTDSLEVLFNIRASECFSVPEYTVFFFNGKQIFAKPQSATLEIIKD